MPSSASSSAHVPTLSLHDALPIWTSFCHSSRFSSAPPLRFQPRACHPSTHSLIPFTRYCESETYVTRPRFHCRRIHSKVAIAPARRSEEHTSELQSRVDLVCRLLLLPPHTFPLFPYTTLFRSGRASATAPGSRAPRPCVSSRGLATPPPTRSFPSRGIASRKRT